MRSAKRVKFWCMDARGVGLSECRESGLILCDTSVMAERDDWLWLLVMSLEGVN